MFENHGCADIKKRISVFKLKYRINKGNKNKLKLFDITFVENNKHKSHIIYQNKKYELKEYFDSISGCFKNKNLISIKLRFISNIVDGSYMFAGYNSLISVNFKSKSNTFNFLNMNSMFDGCNSLTFLSGISDWNTFHVTNMRFMFNECNSLKSLPDMSGWTTSNVIYMNSLFRLCNSLVSLPDLSKWDTHNVYDMSYMFAGCDSLKSLPDLSKWDTQNVYGMNCMFASTKAFIIKKKIKLSPIL